MKSIVGLTVCALAFAAGAADHVRVIDGAVLHPEEGFLLGNGDLSVSAYQDADNLVFRFGKGDVWDRRFEYTDCMKPPTVQEFRDGILKEGWVCNPFDGKGTVATKGTKDEKRMKELCNGGKTPVKYAAYPCPKPTGELQMRLPTDLAGYMRTTYRLFIEEGRLEITCAWPGGVTLVVNAVVDPVENVFSLGWTLDGWNADTFLGRERRLPVWFQLWRWHDPSFLEWARQQAFDCRHGHMFASALQYGDLIKPLEPPKASVVGTEGRVEQHFYPEPTFPEGFRYRMTISADPAAVGRPEVPKANEGSLDAVIHLLPLRTMTDNGAKGEIAVTVTSSRDASLDAAKPKTHAEYVAAAKAAGEAYWRKSAVRFPDDRFMEDLWYATYHARRCVLRGGTVPPGLFLPSTVRDFSHWHGDYHANYNMEQIYWGDMTANRLEQAEAYFDCCDFFYDIGRKIAKDYYGGRGCFIQLEGYPVKALDDYAGRLPLGRMAYMTGWLMTRYWEYYRYTCDREWLAKRGYPFIRDCALFYLDFLLKAPNENLPPEVNDGKYHAFPSICGESGIKNAMQLCDGWQVMVHCRHALWAAIEAAKVLGVDEDLRAQWKDRLDNLPGAWGPGKRSPYELHCLYSMTPEHTSSIRPYKYNPDGWDGKLEPRGSKGSVSWYEGIKGIWKVGRPRMNDCNPGKTFAQFRRDMETWTHANGLVWAMALQNYGRSGAWTETLSVMAPFQEMMLQSWDGAVNVFPRWPKDKDAGFRGWRAQGAFIVSAAQKDGRIVRCEILSEKGEDCVIHGQWIVRDASGAVVPQDKDAFGRNRFKTAAGATYSLEFVSR